LPILIEGGLVEFFVQENNNTVTNTEPVKFFILKVSVSDENNQFIVNAKGDTSR